MQDHLANLVHPVLTYGLELQERLRRGESPDLDTEQAIIKDLLLTDYESQRWIDFGGESVRPSGDHALGNTPRVGDLFLGVRYALVCWLDELFTGDSDWGKAWNERKLEVELYGTNDRAWKFWQQARLAQARTGTDSLEAFYLCVMLGFHGELRDEPEKLRTWIANAKFRLGNVKEPDWPYASMLEPAMNVPPLHGRDQFRHMVLAGWVTVLCVIPIVAFLLVQRLGQ